MKEEEKDVECFQKTGKKRCNTNKLTLEKEKEDFPTTGNSFIVLEGQLENLVYEPGLGDPSKNILHPEPQKKQEQKKTNDNP